MDGLLACQMVMSYTGRFGDGLPDPVGIGGIVPPHSARIVRAGTSPLEAVAPERSDNVACSLGYQLGGSSVTTGSGPLLRRRLYDQNLSDWSARHRKNRQHLDHLAKDCELLKVEIAKQQQEVDDRAESLKQLDERYADEVLVKFNEAKANLEMMTQQKNMLAVQLSENRKHKAQLAKERKLLMADFERKHSELLKTAESRDKLESQLQQLSQHLAQLSGERRRMERELDAVQNNLRANTELADEVHHEIEHVCDGIKDSMDVHVMSGGRIEGSVTSREGIPLSPGH